MNTRALSIIVALLAVIAVLLVVLVSRGSVSHATVSAPPPPASGPWEGYRLPCGHLAFYGILSGSTFSGTCTEGHQWAYASGKWVKAPYP